MLRSTSPRIALALLLGLALATAACGGDDDGGGDGTAGGDAGAADAAALDAAPMPPDGATACAPGECPCFTNYDCPDGYACTSQDESGEEVWCSPGERGTGLAGEPCEGEGDCRSALCIDDDEGQLLCSDVCEDESTCPDSLPTCLYIGFGIDESICAPVE